ncbi:unnamed protein product [Didymodactylos carnosus]|nr:unnamed protein product [Didymodactylos carnosus]CAF3850965.1 unnamed protein product [Didymodactylos carnosus]
MEKEKFHYSLLNSLPNRQSHYAALDWEKTESPNVSVVLNDGSLSIQQSASWKPFTIPANNTLLDIYSKCPRPLQLDRSQSYVQHWVGWNWKTTSSVLYEIQEKGYAVLSMLDEKHKERGVCVSEWRAIDYEIEKHLLEAAVVELARRGGKLIEFSTLPQYVDKKLFEQFGTVTIRQSKSMIRNISLSTTQYEQVKELYRLGQAVYWPADYF